MNLRQFIARRYMRSQNSHSVINHISRVSVVAMAAPVAAIIVLMSVFNGLGDMTRRHFMAVESDIRVLPLSGTTMSADEALLADIGSTKGVESFARVLEQDALIEYDGLRTVVKVKGVDSNYQDIVPINKTLVAGSFTTRMDDNDCLVVGYGVMYNLRLARSTLGKELSLYAINRARFSSLLPIGGYTRSELPLTGIFSVNESYANMVYTSLRAAQELFNYPLRLSAVEVKISADAATADVAEALRSKVGERARVLTREQSNSIYRLMALEKWGVFLVAILILIIASLSIVGALVMIIIDKRDDIATLRTLGMSRSAIRGVFIAEGAIMVVLSLLSGVAVGIALSLAQQYFGLVQLNAATLMVDAYPVRLSMGDVLLTAAVYVVIALLITYLTVRRMLSQKSDFQGR